MSSIISPSSSDDAMHPRAPRRPGTRRHQCRSLLLLCAVPLVCSRRVPPWTPPAGQWRPHGIIARGASSSSSGPRRRAPPPAAQMEEENEESSADGASYAVPESMRVISRALQLEDVAPQWWPPAAAEVAEPLVVAAAANETVADGVEGGRATAVRTALPPQRVPPLSAADLEELRSLPEAATTFSAEEEELLRLSIESLDYLGNWADPESAKDSIVLTCRSPHVVDGDAGPEFTCTYGEFTTERHRLHAHIIDRMLSAANGSADTPLASGVVPLSGGPPALPLPAPNEQHVYITVGVPGSGKDTVLKRYLHALGQQPLLDASADIIKEYLAAWGQDELSVRVRDNSLRHGPGKHLLHSQYLHRESILICDQVARARAPRRQAVPVSPLRCPAPSWASLRHRHARGTVASPSALFGMRDGGRAPMCGEEAPSTVVPLVLSPLNPRVCCASVLWLCAVLVCCGSVPCLCVVLVWL